MSSILIALARARTALARHPSMYWTIALACTAIVVIDVRSVDRQADARRDAWGATRQVWVRSSDQAIGDPIDAEPRTLPQAMVPTGAVDTDPAGMASRRPGRADEVIVDLDVSPSPAAASVPPGHVAITLEPRPLPPVSVGDSVAVLVPADAVDGVVIAVDDGDLSGSVTVAVPVERAGLVADAVAAGAATLAIAG